MVAVIVILTFFEIITRPNYPKLFPEIVEDYKNDDQLMDEVGGYALMNITITRMI